MKNPRRLHRNQHVKPEAIPGRHFGTVIKAAVATEQSPEEMETTAASSNSSMDDLASKKRIGTVQMTKDLKKTLLGTTGLSFPGPVLKAESPTVGGAWDKKISLDGAPLRKSERGLVISVPVKLGSGNEITFVSRLDPQELRFSLLFWDRLDFPMNNIHNFGEGPEVDFLANVGVLTRSRVNLLGGEMATLQVETQLGAFRALDARDTSRWSLARGEKSLGFRPGEVAPNRGILLELHQTIPVPNFDVPLEDILHFKTKRAAELQALRHHLEELYLEIIRSPDRAFAQTVALEDIDTAISEVLTVGRESGMKLKLASFEANLDILDFKQGGLAAIAASEFGLPLSAVVLAGIGGTIMPTLSLKSGVGLKKREKSTNPFEYVSRFHRDLF